MATYYKEGEALKAERIVVQAHEITQPRVVKVSKNHKIQEAHLRRGAYCVIEKPLRNIPSSQSQ